MGRAQGTRPSRRARHSGWVPTYHGAWSMITIPPLVGIIEGGWRWVHLPFLTTWWLGYFCFFAASLWLRSHGKRRYLRPVVVYGAASACFGIVTALSEPEILRWVPVFLPLVGLAAGAAWLRKDRSVWAGFVTVAAACLTLPVTWDIATAGTSGYATTPLVWLHTLLLFGYFAGTVLYVKTNIRERGSVRYLTASVAWHIVWLVLVIIFVLVSSTSATGFAHPLSAWNILVWAGLVVRSIGVPIYDARVRRVPVKAIGVGELVASALVAVALVV